MTTSYQLGYYRKKKEEWLNGLKVKANSYRKYLGHICLDAKTYLTNNGDIEKYPDYGANFSKSLRHNKAGYVNPDDYRKLLAFTRGKIGQLNKICLGGEKKLKNPSSIYTISAFGLPKESYWLPACPSISSSVTAGEMIELYAMALARDIPFTCWSESSTIRSIVKYLNHVEDFWGPKENGSVTVKTLFRGETPSDLKGPFVSQFLYYDVPLGNQNQDNKVFSYLPDHDYLTKMEECRRVQNGYLPPSPQRQKHKRYITTMRDAASYIHSDYPGQAALMAAQILLGLGVPIKPQYHCNEDYFIDLGQVDIIDLIHRSVRLALASAWHHKWNQLKLRPEVVGMYIDEAKKDGCNPYCLSDQILDSPILEKVYQKWGTYLLPQCYSEGAPTHPSYPSGHATWAGAAVTILRAFFEGDFEIDAYQPNSDGTELVSLGYKVKVKDELTKLETFIGNARNMAGIHYRSDMLGIYLGEAVGIQVLEEAVKRYAYRVKFEFEARNGKTVVIKNY